MSDRGNSLLRFGDRYFGIPLIFLLGLFTRNKKSPESFKSVGFLATAAIGDTLLISAVIKDFMTKYPGVNIKIFCGKSNRGTFEMALPNLDLITIPVNNPLKSIKTLRQHSFDVFIDFGPWPRINSLLSFYVKSKFKVGFNSIKQYRHYVYNYKVPHLDSCHEIDNLRRLVKCINVQSESLPFLGEATPDKDNPYIVVHMFPSGYKAHYKEWSDFKWVNLINGLTDKDYIVKLTGAPKDVDSCNRIVSKCKKPDSIITLAGKTNLLEVAEVLKKSSVIVSVNTGIMHMAAAYNQNVIALHGPTSPLRWGPLCNNKFDFEATTISAGCLHLGFEYINADNKSLDSIDEKVVLDKTLHVMNTGDLNE